MMELLREIPETMREWCSRHYSNIQVNVCNTDVENGYGQRISGNVKISLPYEKCHRCGYHSLWNPDDTETGCRANGGHHTLTHGWDDVFVWNIESRISLKDSFDWFLKQQPDRDWDPLSPYKKVAA